MVRGIANSKIGFGDLILLLRYFFKLKVSTHPNYLWPPLTIVFAILAKQLRYHGAVIGGFILSVLGLLLVVNPDILDLAQLMHILQQNPIAYFFAFLGALLWPCYSVLTKKYAQGQNAVPLFFMVTALALWGNSFCGE